MAGTVKVRGVEHYYEGVRQDNNLASKSVMVFIHGWGGSSRYWLSTAQAFSTEFDCLLYDLRGFGRSKLVPNGLNSSYELAEYAEDLAELLAALGITKAYLHSHSMGASIATWFMDLYPQKVAGAILACNGIFEYNERAFAAFHKFGKYVVQFRYPWFLKVPFADRLFMARFLCSPIPDQERRIFLEDFIEADYEAALGTIYTSVSKMAVDVMPGKFAAITIPTLLIAGEKDQIIPAKMARQAAALNSQINYVEIRETAHFPMLEAPEVYRQQVADFLVQINYSAR